MNTSKLVDSGTVVSRMLRRTYSHRWICFGRSSSLYRRLAWLVPVDKLLTAHSRSVRRLSRAGEKPSFLEKVLGFLRFF